MDFFDEKEKYIFVSYAHKDAAKVCPIVQSLMDAGFSVWYDEGLVQGENYHEDIAAHITDCTTALIFLSNASANSTYCKMEIEYAFSCGKKLSVVYLEENISLSPGIQLLLNSIQSLMYCEYDNNDDFLKSLFAVPCLRMCAKKGSPHFLSEEKTSALNHISIETGKVGKKANSITESIEVIEAGTNTVARRERITNTEVIKRTVATHNNTYIPTVNDALQMGLSLLRLGSFFEADMFFNECIKESEQNGTAWLGLLCAKIKSKELCDKLTSPTPDFSEEIQNNANALSSLTEELAHSVEYAAEKYIAENILEYVFATIKYVSNEKTSNVDKLLLFILQYESNVYERAMKYVAENIKSWAFFHSSYEYESICNEFLKRIDDTDAYIAFLEQIVEGYSAVKNVELARKWNDRILEIDEGNLQAIYKYIYLSAGVLDAEGFKSQIQFVYSAKDVVVPFLEKSINKISKSDAEKLLDYIGEIECFCLSKGCLQNAESYFEFIIKYKFPSRTDLLENHKDKIEILAKSRCLSFFEKYMSAMSHESVSWHIKSRLKFADCLRSIDRYNEATSMYITVFALEENNADAMNGIFACDLKYNGTDGHGIRWENFDASKFEGVLSACPNKKKQISFVKQYITLCLSAVKTSVRIYDKCCVVFDQLIKYFPESESKTVFGYIDDIAVALLEKRQFQLAIKYANLSISNEATYNIKARYVILLASLGCENEKEFVKCEKFDKNMNEYKMLLLSCRADANALQKYTVLAKNNESEVEAINKQRKQDIEKEIQKKKREEQKKERELMKLKDAAYKEGKLYLIAGVVSLISIIVSLICFFIYKYIAFDAYYDSVGVIFAIFEISVFVISVILFVDAYLMMAERKLSSLISSSMTVKFAYWAAVINVILSIILLQLDA